MYAGDEPTPTTSTVNDQERKPGFAPKFEGKPVLLRRDQALELFKKRLSAKRHSKLDGTACYDRQCYFYDVTATLTGVFLAAPKDFRRGGYGHLGCCHLLIVQAVDEVHPKRTQVPAGGKFECSKELWNVDSELSRKLLRRPCQGYKDCRSAAGEQLAKIAAHWNDALDPVEGTTSGFIEGRPQWESLDLVKSYTLHFPSANEGTAEVTRTLCREVSPPYAEEVPISCRNHWTDFKLTEKDAKAVEDAEGAGKADWRLKDLRGASEAALKEAIQNWRLNLPLDLVFKQCTKPDVSGGQQFTWCSWLDQNGMHSFVVQLSRFDSMRKSRKWESAPWFLTRGFGTSCDTE
jgi:hypothetical protein